MSWTLRWTKAAKADLTDIWLYIATDNLPAADRQIDRIEHSVNRLADFPRSGPERNEIGKHVRGIVQNCYLILYQLEESENCVSLLRVVDGRRDLSAIFIGGDE